MFKLDKVKGILFDYGGTIDSNGMHWAEVIWMAYEALKVPVSKAVFRDAYVHGERTLGKNPIVKPHHTFLDMLRLKSDLQIQWLKENGHLSAEAVTPELPEQLADWCYEYARKAIDSARPILEQLAERYPLVLVSNFYGNIESVLKDFGLDKFMPNDSLGAITANLLASGRGLDWKEAMAKVDFELASLYYNGYDYKNVV